MTKEVHRDPPSFDDLVQQLCQIKTSQDLLHWKQHSAVTPELINAMMAAVRRLFEKPDPDTAGRLADWCILLVPDLDDQIMTAKATATKGIALARRHDHANSLSYFDEALRLYEHAGDELLAAKVRMNRISIYGHLSRYDEALRDADISNEVFTRLGEKFLLAMNLNNLGELLFRLDRLQEWLVTIGRAEQLLKEMGEQKALAMVYMNHAVLVTSLNMAAEAYKYYELAREMAEATSQTYLASCCNYNLGYLHYVQGEYTKALDILTETREKLKGDQWYVPLCDLTQSEIYLEMNMSRDAVRLAEQACKGFESTGKPFETAKALTIMGIARSELHEERDAAHLLDQARKMFQDQGNHVRAAAIDLYQGVQRLQSGRYLEARLVAQEAYRTFSKEDVKPRAAFAQVVSARASLKAADLEAARHDAAIAVSLYGQSPTPWVGHKLHAVLGEICLAEHRLVEARLELLSAVDECERVRGNIAPDELRLNFLKDKIPVYDLLLNTNLRLGDSAALREAFETAERAKSRTLVDLLAGSIDSLRDIASCSLPEIQEILPPRAALVEYFMTDDQVIAFCVSQDRFEVIREVCSRRALKQRFEFVRFQFARLGANAGTSKEREALQLANIQGHLAELYEMLMRPLDVFLREHDSLVFVPFDFLHYLPFHALFGESCYLIDRFRISYAPSASIYRLFKKKQTTPDGPALLVGVPDDRAPHIPDEIESIRSVLPNVRTFVGGEATRDCVAREMTAARIIHIASHATFRPDNPMFSSIQLSDKPLTFFDIYNLRTSASLVTLSGCGTGLSSVVAGDELLGLIRGFLYAGATSVLTSLWDVNDRTTAQLMKDFYRYLTDGVSKSESLKSAMLRLREEYPHPYYWAPFLLMD